jgi:hypothetical protein
MALENMPFELISRRGVTWDEVVIFAVRVNTHVGDTAWIGKRLLQLAAIRIGRSRRGIGRRLALTGNQGERRHKAED